MSVKLSHTSVDELDRLHSKLAIANAMTPSLQEIETHRAAQADRRKRVRLVKDD